jgi:fumarate hydratase class II
LTWVEKDSFGPIQIPINAYATVNVQFGLEQNISYAITEACDDILNENLKNQFPLPRSITPGRIQSASNNSGWILSKVAGILTTGF